MYDNRPVEIKKSLFYADALLMQAIKLGGKSLVLRVREELLTILYTARCNAKVSVIINLAHEVSFKDRYIDTDKLIDQIFKYGSQPLINVFKIMICNKDAHLVKQISKVYEVLIENTYNVAIVDLFTYVTLDDHLREIIIKKFVDDIDSDIILHEHIRKDILGGIIIRYKDRYIDLSIRNQLNMIKNNIGLSK